MNCVTTTFEEIYRRPDLIIPIYQQLNIEDQLRLAVVNAELKHTFKNFIHLMNYEVLNLTNIPPDKYLVSTKSDENCIVLTTEAMMYLIDIYRDDVTEFCHRHEYKPEITGVCLKPLFHNLSCLHYEQMVVPDEHLKMIAQQCPHLRELHLIMCFSEENGQGYLEIGEDLKISTLELMQNLNILTVEAAYSNHELEYSVFYDLITRLNLLVFKTKSCLIQDNENKQSIFESEHHQLRELKLSLISVNWEGNLMNLFRVLENLVELIIYDTFQVDEIFLETLANTCKKLQVLRFQGSGDFKNIVNFLVPPNLKELTIENCEGLTHENLRQILTEYKLEKFSSHKVSYEGEFRDFLISPYIRSLDVYYVGTFKFRSAYINNIHLQELIWHENREDDYWEYGECPDPGALETCINLETLNVSNGWLPYARILKLPHLKYLTVSQDMAGLGWTYICAVLQHPTLYELHIHTYTDCEHINEILHSDDIPSEGFAINVKVLKMPQKLFKRAYNFWLDLMSKNHQLKLICGPFDVDYEFLRRLVENVNFPKNLKTIVVWGFRVKCTDLRRNFDYAITNLDPIINILSLDSKFFDTIGRLILSREN